MFSAIVAVCSVLNLLVYGRDLERVKPRAATQGGNVAAPVIASQVRDPGSPPGRESPDLGGESYWPDLAPSEAGANSSPIQRWNAVMLCWPPRKFFTRSLADIEPPGSSTTWR